MLSPDYFYELRRPFLKNLSLFNKPISTLIFVVFFVGLLNMQLANAVETMKYEIPADSEKPIDVAFSRYVLADPTTENTYIAFDNNEIAKFTYYGQVEVWRIKPIKTVLSIDTDPNDNLYVLSQNDTHISISKYDANGNPLIDFDTHVRYGQNILNGAFENSKHIAVDAIRGRIFVSYRSCTTTALSSCLLKIKAFDLNGGFLAESGQSAINTTDIGYASISDMYIDCYGYPWISVEPDMGDGVYIFRHTRRILIGRLDEGHIMYEAIFLVETSPNVFSPYLLTESYQFAGNKIGSDCLFGGVIPFWSREMYIAGNNSVFAYGVQPPPPLTGGPYATSYTADYEQEIISGGTGFGQLTLAEKLSANGAYFTPAKIWVIQQFHPVWAQLFDATGNFLFKISQHGSGDGQFHEPSGLATDNNGNIVVVDRYNHRVQVLTENGAFLKQFGSKGTKPGQFSFPTDVATDKAGRYYVTDNGNSRVQVFDSAGAFLFTFGTVGTGYGQFSSVNGIAINNNNNFAYVVDGANHRVQVFDPKGVFQFSFGTQGSLKGELLRPTDVGIHPTTGDVYVTEQGNSRVQVFGPTGTFIGSFGSFGTGNGQFRSPSSIDFDLGGNIYVTESTNNRVQVFNKNGQFLRKFGTRGYGNGQFDGPFGIVVTNTNNIFVSDFGNNRIQVFNNQIPVADSQNVVTDEDTAIDILLTGSDSEGDPLTYTITSSPGNGTLSGTAPNLTYTPDSNFSGSDSFAFRVNDGTSNSAAAMVSITVNAINDAPTANGQVITTDEDVAVSITLTATDADGDSLSYAVITGPTNGTLSGTAPNLIYTPNANFNGSDSISFKVNDGTVDSAAAMVSITVNAMPEAPIISGTPPTSIPAGQLYSFTPTASDADGDALVFSVANLPFWASFDNTTGTMSGTPANNDVGTYSGIIISVSDGIHTSSLPVFDLQVTGKGTTNRPPAPPGLVGPADGANGINRAGIKFQWHAATDPDGDPVTYRLSVCEDPTFGSCGIPTTSNSLFQTDIMLAGLGSGTGLLLIGVLGYAPTRRRMILNLIVVLVIASSMGGCDKDHGNAGVPILSEIRDNLAGGTTYYWKVTALDGNGGATDSQVWRFTTNP